MSPDTVAVLALDGVRAGRDVVFTDPVVAPMLDDQLARLKGSWTTRGSNGSPSA